MDGRKVTTKRSLAWHEKCLNNAKNGVEQRKIEIRRMQAELERYEKNNAFSELQLKTAKERGMLEYDDERFLKKQNPRYSK